MLKTVSQLQAIIEPAVEAMGHRLYGCEFHTQPRKSTLIVYVDNVSLDDCAKISRQVSAVLDVEDPISGRYLLEVSSPGIARPLFTLEHYQQSVGKAIKLRLKQSHRARRNYTGILQAISGDQLKFSLEEDDELIVNFTEVEKSKLISDL